MGMAGFKQVRQPLAFIITNSGAELASACGTEHTYATRILTPEFQSDDQYFSYVCALDKDDDPINDESCWIKANPSLPDIPGMDYLRAEIKSSRLMPSKRSSVERLNLCVWAGAEDPWLHKDVFTKCEVEPEDFPSEEELRQYPCYMGIDLSAKEDLTAACAVWDATEGDHKLYYADMKLWTPEDTLQEKADLTGIPYIEWKEAGFIDTCRGKLIDYGVVARYMAEMKDKYNLRGIAYDQWNFPLFLARMEAIGLNVSEHDNEDGSIYLVEHSQGYQTNRKTQAGRLVIGMSSSIDESERIFIEGNLRLKKSPPTRFAVLAARMATDNENNRKFDRKNTHTKIDPCIALVEALGFAVHQYYDKRMHVNYDADYFLPE